MSNFFKNDIFGSYQLACECLNDVDRTVAFKKSIVRLVNENSNVLELGAGTGILSIIAASSGAKHVDAVEITKIVAEIAKNNAVINGFGEKINIINKDALKLKKSDLSISPSLVIMEMISTGLIEELQVPAFNNLIKKKIVHSDSICCPSSFETSATLANVDYFFYGHEVRAILHQESWQRNLIKSEHSGKNRYNIVDFNEAIRSNTPVNATVEKDLNFTITKKGTINSLLITSEAILDGNNKIGWTSAINIPLILPINDKIVEKGDQITVKIKYQMGKGLENLVVV